MLNISKDASPAEILRSAHVIAVLGCSDRPDRDSYTIFEYLLKHSYTVYPVNPHVTSVMGHKSYATLADVPEHIDIVNVFRRPEFALDIVAEAIAVKAVVVWFQLGTLDESDELTLSNAPIVIMPESCIRIDHQQMKYHETARR